ncbi:MAG: hypothetical protein LBL57_00635 [Tannerella sp.]|nr:hypothetical protein [Tannerella sp.]
MREARNLFHGLLFFFFYQSLKLFAFPTNVFAYFLHNYLKLFIGRLFVPQETVCHIYVRIHFNYLK